MFCVYNVSKRYTVARFLRHLRYLRVWHLYLTTSTLCYRDSYFLAIGEVFFCNMETILDMDIMSDCLLHFEFSLSSETD